MSTDQRGTALIVTMIMLAVLTTLTLNIMAGTQVDLQIVHNRQSQKQAEAAAQQIIEAAISDPAFFRPPLSATQQLDIDGLQVTLPPPRCLAELSPPGYGADYSLSQTVGWRQTHWEVSATAVDPVTGARAVIHEGIVVMLGGGNCP